MESYFQIYHSDWHTAKKENHPKQQKETRLLCNSYWILNWQRKTQFILVETKIVKDRVMERKALGLHNISFVENIEFRCQIDIFAFDIEFYVVQ